MSFVNYPDGVNEKIDDPKPVPPQNWVQRNFKWVVAGVIALVVAFIGLGIANWNRAVNADGHERQNNLMALHQGIETKLGTCLDNTDLAIQIAERERATLKETLKAVVSARYVDANGKPVDVGTPAGQAIMINVIKEAYPNVSPDLFKQLMTVAVGCRNEVAGAQTRLQGYAADFLSWRKQGNIVEGSIREQYPNDELVVQGLNGELKGMAALRFMVEPISTAEAKETMKTKVMPRQQLPSGEPTK